MMVSPGGTGPCWYLAEKAIGPISRLSSANTWGRLVLGVRRMLRQVGGDLGALRHPPPDRGLADGDAELEQFPMDARCTPQPIGVTHAPDQITRFWTDPGPSRTT
jgi:hypothetical protein